MIESQNLQMIKFVAWRWNSYSRDITPGNGNVGAPHECQSGSPSRTAWHIFVWKWVTPCYPNSNGLSGFSPWYGLLGWKKWYAPIPDPKNGPVPQLTSNSPGNEIEPSSLVDQGTRLCQVQRHATGPNWYSVLGCLEAWKGKIGSPLKGGSFGGCDRMGPWSEDWTCLS